jgi:hypothetical protein
LKATNIHMPYGFTPATDRKSRAWMLSVLVKEGLPLPVAAHRTPTTALAGNPGHPERRDTPA